MARAKTGLVAVRVPLDLLERVDAAGARTDIMVAALRAHFDPAGPVVDDARLAAAHACAVASEQRIAELEALLRAKPRVVVAPIFKPGTLERADPASSKAVAQVLPVTGTQFPKQLTHWQKQAAESARQKPGKAGR